MDIPAQPIPLIGFDTETELIGEGNIMPPVVCGTFDMWTEASMSAAGNVYGPGQPWGVGDGDGPMLLDHLLKMFQMAYSRQARVIIQEAPFDLGVVLRYCHDIRSGVRPGDAAKATELYMLIWETLDASMAWELGGHGLPFISDTILREKLYNLSTHGGIDQYPATATTSARDLRYTLADLAMTHFGIDMSKSKVTTDMNGRVYNAAGKDITGTAEAGAAWRLRYPELHGYRFADYPKEAAEYAIEDATAARCIWWNQERKRTVRYHGSMNSESLQVASGLALRLYSSPGFYIDQGMVANLRVVIGQVYERCDVGLRLNGVLRPDGSVNQSVLHDRIRTAWRIKGEQPITTGSKDKNGDLRISADSEVLEKLRGVDPVVDLYADRSEFAKIQTSFLPNLTGTKVYSNYDTLKETGRVSSYGNSDKSHRKPLYPAVNIQQIPRGQDADPKKGQIEIKVRECFLPPPGYVMGSHDYAALELCSVAQVTYSLFGYSVHRDKNLAGYDLHSYLGAGMASTLAPQLVDNQVEFDKAYHAFIKNRKAARHLKPDDQSPEAKVLRDFVKEVAHYRNFAKPVGLGLPGGLGQKTLVTFAKTTYGVDMTEDQAGTFKDLWRSIYPEMPEFFRWLQTQVDQYNTHSDGGDLYWYETQGYNRMRAGAGYCAAANGKCMQSLGADGAKRSTAWIARACYGGLPADNPFSILSGCLPLAFIHDENLIAYPETPLLTEQALAASMLMIHALQISMPDVKLGCEPALMRRWTKKAEPEWVKDEARADMVRDYICRTQGVDGYTRLQQALGPTWDPKMRLACWDDVNQKKAA